MTQHKLTATFYIAFTLLALIPSIFLAKIFQAFLEQYIFVSLLKNYPLDWRLVEAPVAVFFIGILFWVYEKFIWRLHPFYFFHKIPDINGRFEGYVTNFS